MCVCVRETEHAGQRGLRTSKAALALDHVLVIFGEHPGLSYMTQYSGDTWSSLESYGVLGVHLSGVWINALD